MVWRVIIFWVVLWPGVCFSEIGSTYDAYMNWEDWAHLRTGFQPGLASSYDREGYNNDFSYYEEPNGLCTGYEPNVTAATIQGPGAIYRFWMPHHTAKRNFVIRMYFDDQQTPQIETNSLEWLAGSFNYFAAPLVDTFVKYWL